MAIKGILFNTDMVRAILDGRKTVTRRVIKPANTVRAKAEGYHQGHGLWISDDTDNPDKCEHIKDYSVSPLWSSFAWYTKKYAPYQLGGLLYVRETIWQEFGRTMDISGEISGGFISNYKYMADNPDEPKSKAYGHVWIKRPSIHMPKEAARIWLKVTDVRAEQLQSMKTEDFQKEGMTAGDIPAWRNIIEQNFRKLWDSTIPKRDLDRYGWYANPWVWVIEFERCEKPKET